MKSEQAPAAAKPKPSEASSLLEVGVDQLFSRLTPPLRLLLGGLLFASFVLQTICLFPTTIFLYLDVDEPLGRILQPGSYTLLTLLSLCSNGRLWPIRFLVTVCSLIFPPLELLLLTILLGTKMSNTRRQRVLTYLGYISRWALFATSLSVVLLLLVWQQNETVTVGPFSTVSAGRGSEPRCGFYLFAVAVACLMAAVTILQEINYPFAVTTPSPLPPNMTKRPLIVNGNARSCFALLLAFGALFVTLGVSISPTLQVRAVQGVAVVEHIGTVGTSLFSKMPLFALSLCFFLFILPFATVLAAIAMQLVPLSAPGRWCPLVVRYLCQWSLLDVHVAALICFLILMDDFLTLKLRAGAYCVIFYLPFFVGSVYSAETTLTSAVNKRLRLAKSLPTFQSSLSSGANEPAK